MWYNQYGTDRPVTVDFNNRRNRSESTVGNRPNSATLTFPYIESATRWVQTAKQFLWYNEGRCKVQYVYYGYENQWYDDNDYGYYKNRTRY